MATETLTLTPAQALAYNQLLPFLKGAHEARLAVLEGYAGTGKTFLVARLLRDLMDLKIAVAAPTNKAVRVLRDKLVEAGVAVLETGDPESGVRLSRARIGCVCRSIHSLLGLKLRELENGQQETTSDRESTLRDYDVVVVDECSMLNRFLFEKIVMERGAAQVLFVGDPAQLPPVREETLSPVFAKVSFVVRLAEVVRQAAENPIIQLSMRLRQLIEVGVKASALTLLDALPPLASGPKAALVREPASTVVAWWLSQREEVPDSDVRIIAYTNDRVQWYNQQIHQTLHPHAPTRFVVGQQVIVHKQCEAQRRVGGGMTEPDRLITSEELRVMEVAPRSHPFFPQIAAEWLVLRGETGQHYEVFAVQDETDWQRRISRYFEEFRALKAQSERAADSKERFALKEAAHEASNQGWALARAFAPLRHAYAITCHKSQGSTFDCALVDFTDLARMRDPFEFNRALYVAITRSREFLALVVT